MGKDLRDTDSVKKKKKRGDCFSRMPVHNSSLMG